MDEHKDTPAAGAPGKVEKGRDEREARLAAALRDNLRRRKGAPPKPTPPMSGGER